MQRFAFVVVVVVVTAFAAPANARLGNASYIVATSCNSCHGTSALQRPTLTVTQVTPDPLVRGGSAVFHIEARSNNDDGAGRFATFVASALKSAGAFKDGDDTEVCEVTGGCPSSRTAIRDISGRAWVDGAFGWDIELENLGPGSFNLAVGVNDINHNNLSSGDRNTGTSVPFTVAEGEGEGEGDPGEGEGEGEVGAEGEGEVNVDPDGSCCGGSPAQASAGLLGLLLLRRRRHR
jgi:hypothetical protein